MPFDAFFLTAVRRELEGSLTGCRIDKVQQPQRDTLILSMRCLLYTSDAADE